MGREHTVPEDTGCQAMHRLLDTLTRPWMLHIIWTLSSQGPTRFGALRRAVPGISARVLTERLRALEERGFLLREYKPTIPPEVTYRLTARMCEIQKVMGQLFELAMRWDAEDRAGRTEAES